MRVWGIALLCALGVLVLIGVAAYWKYENHVTTFSIVRYGDKGAETVLNLELKGREAKMLSNRLAIDRFYSQCRSLAKTVGVMPIVFVSYGPDTFSDYSLREMSIKGEFVDSRIFWNQEPFLIKRRGDASYSIEEFFTKEEKRKMKELIPSWNFFREGEGRAQK